MSAERRNDRECEIKWCGAAWATKESYDYLVICPSCGNSGYHMPKAKVSDGK